MVREENGVAIFADDDKAYQNWLKRHPDGFVVNTPRTLAPGYLVLHRATCPQINRSAMTQPGDLTEREYVKICARDVADLRSWAAEQGREDGSFSDHCPVCQPQ